MASTVIAVAVNLAGEGAGGADGDDDDDNDGDEDEMARRYQEIVAVAYRMEMEGRDDKQLKRQMSGLMQRWNRSFRSSSDRKMMEEALGDDDGNDVAPLTQEGPTRQQRPSMVQKWRDSWSNRGSRESQMDGPNINV